MGNPVIKTKVRAVGNSLGVIIPKEVIDKLALEKGDELFLVETSKGHYELTPYNDELETQLEAAKIGMRQYRNALKELAK